MLVKCQWLVVHSLYMASVRVKSSNIFKKFNFMIFIFLHTIDFFLLIFSVDYYDLIDI